MNVLLDTNILARLAQTAHHQHPIASRSVEIIKTRGDEPCLVPQILYEFWVVCTRPRAQNGLEKTVSETQTELARILRLFPLYRDERAIFERWKRIVTVHEVQGKSAHDARLVAAMDRHRLTHILTFNVRDFIRFPAITILSPDAVTQSMTA